MSTRCQIRLIENGKHLDFYNHFNGYWNGVGKELSSTLLTCNGPFPFLVDLITTYGGYELTNALHGDVEYYYELNWDEHSFIGYELELKPWKEGCRFDELKLKPAFVERRDLLPSPETSM